MRQVAGHCEGAPVYFLTHPELTQASPEGILAALQSCWKDTLPPLLIAGAWANELLARFGNTFPRVQARYNVAEIAARNGGVELACPAFGGHVQRVSRAALLTEHPLIVTLAPGAMVRAGTAARPGPQRVFRVPLELEYDRQRDALAAVAAAANGDREKTIADAEFIIDVGYAVRNKENFDLIIGPLKKRLEEMGVKNVMIGGTRKVVEELKLLAPNQQIGQTGTPVNPKVIISIGVSGAPQHIDYIGERATIIAFNKDPNAPLMTLNTRRARPKVVPIVGDLYETVPQFLKALK
jgi:electron transfer flavoprotein alpha subunit